MKLNEVLTRKSTLLVAYALLSCLGGGCAFSRVDARAQSTATAVALSGKNYRMIQPGARGQSYGFRFLGIIPLSNPHFASARQALYASVKEPLTGKAVALANQMEDKSTLYLILFSVPKVTITADVIEFTDRAEVR
jgi:hypothetical protein